jgi:ubiquinone/menaquinone biosynthesis C-methylase UbiE
LLPARLAKSDIPNTYSWIAPVHDLLAVQVEAKARKLALEWAAVRDGEHILEVAVGTGLSFQHLLKQNPHGWTVGVDLSPAMLRRARRRAARTGFTCYHLEIGDAYYLPFPDRTFDLVLNSYMFDLLPESDFVTVLQEFRRVLKPGGRLVQINLATGPEWYNRIWEWLYRIHPALMGGCRGVAMEPSFRAAGFTEVRRTYVSCLTYPSEILRGYRT